MTTFLVLWLFAQAIGVALVFLFTFGLGKPVSPAATPRVAIIVAVKGRDPEFDEFLVRLFAQDYPDFRVIFSVEAANDAAVPAIEPYWKAAKDRVALVVAGLGVDEGQKTTNLLAAVPELTPEDEILVLADADIWPERDWLRRLVAPVIDDRADIVSGFPWLIVKDGKLSSLVLTSLAASVATIPRLPFLNGVWGGTAAMRQAHFHALDMTRKWRGTLSDDLQLTNVAQEKGDTILAPREMLLRTAIHTNGFSDVIAEARRWYMLVRVHMPVTYGATVLAMTFAAAGWLFAIGGTLALRRDAIIVLVLALVLSGLRTLGRRRLVKALWGDAGVIENRPFLKWDWALSPLAMLLSAVCGWSALLMRRTTWAGTTYEMRGPQDITILARSTPSAPHG